MDDYNKKLINDTKKEIKRLEMIVSNPKLYDACNTIAKISINNVIFLDYILIEILSRFKNVNTYKLEANRAKLVDYSNSIEPISTKELDKIKNIIKLKKKNLELIIGSSSNEKDCTHGYYLRKK